MEKGKKPLNHRQEKFCRLLVTPDENGRTRSRIDAYFGAYGEDKSRTEASNAASRLLNDPRIKARVDELMEQAAHKEMVEQLLPFKSILDNINALLADDKHPAARIAGVKLALKVREQFLPSMPPLEEEPDRFAVMSDEELMAEARRVLGL